VKTKAGSFCGKAAPLAKRRASAIAIIAGSWADSPVVMAGTGSFRKKVGTASME